MDDEEIRCPPTTHFVATVDNLNDMCDFDSEDIDGMDDDVGEVQEPPLTGWWTATSSYDIYMVDTPKETNGDEAMEDNPLGRKAKHGRHRRHSKPRHNNTAPEMKAIRMVPKRNTALISPPSSSPDRPRWDTWRGTTIHPPPKTR